MVNGGVSTYAGVYFKLTSDLNMNSIAWVPIGNSTSSCFCGKFNGNSHFINNIRITGSYTYKGLFGVTGSGFQCTNLGVKTTTTSSEGQYCGGIVGATQGNTIIQNCYNTGTISAPTTNSYDYTGSTFAYSGGIVGFVGVESAGSSISTRIVNCYNTGGISVSKSTTSESGGIVGCVSRYSRSNSIENCYNTGTISSPNSQYAKSGGIVGHFGSTAGYSGISLSIENCYNTGAISSSSPFNAYSGGIIGYINGGTTTLTKCYNKNGITASTNISGYTGTRSSGGLIGYSNSSITITYSYNRGNVAGSSYTGGLIGYIRDESSSITNSYNTGTLTGGTKGGIRGNTTGSVSNCYYLSTCGGIVSGGTSKTEAAMRSASFPVLLNANSTVFEMDVTPNVNDGYPIFGTDIILITTKAATNLNFTSATLKGSYETQYSWPGGDADVVGFEYKKTSATNYTTVYTNVGTPASYNLTGLQLGTEYQYRMFVQKNGVTYYGQIITFSTLTCDLQASITKSVTTICQGETATFTASGTSTHSNTFNYRWSNNNTTSQIQVNNANTYTVTVSDANGCSATASASVTVNPVPQGVISGNTTLCSGQSSTLTASGANSYRWNTGATAPAITVNNSGTYTCTFSNSYGCTSTQSAVVTVFEAPIITGNTAFCAGDYTTLTASGGDDYLWSTGATSAAINVNTAGTYSVTASSANNCSATTSVTVIQNQASDVIISGTTVICSGIGTSLSASTGIGYLWSTGETSQSIVTNNPGIYSVTVTNNNGCTSSASITVSYMEMPTITGNTTICSGEGAALSTNSLGSYLWSTGAETPSITVNTPGNYSVTVSLPNGCSSSASVNVTTASLPTPAISGNTTICQGETATLVATGGTSYQWSAMGQGNSITVTEAGTYTVTATNAQGCSATASTYVTVNPLPNITISGNTAVCQGNTTTLVANGAQSYLWNTGSTNAAISVGSAGNFIVTGYSAQGCTSSNSVYVEIYPTYNTPVSHSMCQGETYNFFGQNLTNAGTYSHTLYTQNGCDSIITLTLSVRDLPVVTINGNTTICQGETATLVATGGTSYQWSAMGQGNSITVTEAGTYTVTATNAQGCSATASTYVTVNPLPNITISGNTSVCQGNTTTLVANGAATYQWSNGVSGAVNTIGTFGIYTVTGISAEGCSNTASATVVVYQLPVLNISGDTELCSGETTTLTANGAATYLWNNGTTDAALTTSAAGTYTVIGTDEHGCYSTASIDVAVNYPSSTEVTVVECDSYEWQGITRTESGDYTWTGQTAAGCDSVVTLHLTITPSDTTGIITYNDGIFAVYPNPTSGIVTLQLTPETCNRKPEIQMFDIYGQRLHVMPVRGERTQIDMTSYAPGVYLIKLVGDGRVIGVRKVVKQ